MTPDYNKIAEAMIESEENAGLARRYLAIRRRQYVIEGNIDNICPAQGLDWFALVRKLEADPDRTIRRLVECSNRLWILRSHLESEIAKALNRVRFSAIIAKDTALETLALIPRAVDKMALVVAYSPEAGLLIDGHAVQTAWGKGRGLAVIHRTDLARLLSMAEYGVTIQALDDHWEGWVDCTPAGTPRNLPKGMQGQHLRFDYYAAEQEEQA